MLLRRAADGNLPIIARYVSEGLQAKPRLRVGLPSRGTSVPLVNPWARRETPMPLSNTPSHNPLKKRAGKLRVGIVQSVARLSVPFHWGQVVRHALRHAGAGESRRKPASDGRKCVVLYLPIAEGVHPILDGPQNAN